MRIVYTISPCLLYVYVSKLLALFHHTSVCLCIHVFSLFHHIYYMFMYPSYLHYFTILFCIFMYPCFYSISPYFWYVYVSKLLALFHYTDMFMYPSFWLYFTISFVCLCIHIYVLFHRAY